MFRREGAVDDRDHESEVTAAVDRAGALVLRLGAGDHKPVARRRFEVEPGPWNSVSPSGVACPLLYFETRPKVDLPSSTPFASDAGGDAIQPPPVTKPPFESKTTTGYLQIAFDRGPARVLDVRDDGVHARRRILVGSAEVARRARTRRDRRGLALPSPQSIVPAWDSGGTSPRSTSLEGVPSPRSTAQLDGLDGAVEGRDHRRIVDWSHRDRERLRRDRRRRSPCHRRPAA